MSSTAIVLWMFLASGDVVQREFPGVCACLDHKRLIEIDQASRGSGSVERMLCLPVDLRAPREDSMTCRHPRNARELLDPQVPK